MSVTRRATLMLPWVLPWAIPSTRGAVLDRPARLVTGAGPGSGTDAVTRLLAQHITGDYALHVVVENRVGAFTRLALEHVKAAAPDGTTLMVVPMPVLSLFPHVYPRTTRYDPMRDFIAVATLGTQPYSLMIRADHPARDLRGFLDWARARGGVTCFSPLGSPQHMLAVALAREAGLVLTMVPYRQGFSAALPDLLTGRIDMILGHMGDNAPPARDGRTRLLAASTAARLPGFPAVPGFAEAGFPALTAEEAITVILPVGTPPALVDALHAAISRAVEQDAMRERLARLEITPGVLSSAATTDLLRAEMLRWGSIVAASGFVAEE